MNTAHLHPHAQPGESEPAAVILYVLASAALFLPLAIYGLVQLWQHLF